MCQTVFFLIFLPCLCAHTGINFISNLNEMAITIASEITRVLVCDHDPVTTETWRHSSKNSQIICFSDCDGTLIILPGRYLSLELQNYHNPFGHLPMSAEISSLKPVNY